MLTHFPPPPNIKAPPLSYATRVGDLLFVSDIAGFDDPGGYRGRLAARSIPAA